MTWDNKIQHETAKEFWKYPYTEKCKCPTCRILPDGYNYDIEDTHIEQTNGIHSVFDLIEFEQGMGASSG